MNNILVVVLGLLSLSCAHGFHDPLLSAFFTEYGGTFVDPFDVVEDDQSLNADLVTGRFLLKHHPRDGLERVLKAQGMDEDAVEAIRDSTIVMTISVDEEGEVSMITEDGSSSDEVVFTPGTAVNITNPLNGELTQIKSVILSPSSLQTLATGLESGNREIKTWDFLPSGLNLHTDFSKENSLLPILANQVLVRVDDDNESKTLRPVLRWV